MNNEYNMYKGLNNILKNKGNKNIFLVIEVSKDNKTILLSIYEDTKVLDCVLIDIDYSTGNSSLLETDKFKAIQSFEKICGNTFYTSKSLKITDEEIKLYGICICKDIIELYYISKDRKIKSTIIESSVNHNSHIYIKFNKNKSDVKLYKSMDNTYIMLVTDKEYHIYNIDENIKIEDIKRKIELKCIVNWINIDNIDL